MYTSLSRIIFVYVSLFILSVSTVFAQFDYKPPGTAVLDEKPLEIGSPKVLLGPGCDGIVEAFVYITNPIYDLSRGIYTVPPGTEPIYLDYIFIYQTHIYSGTQIVYDFDLWDVDESDILIYSSVVEIPINFTDACQGINDYIDVSGSVSLVTSDGNPYPFGDYDGPWDIFSCQVFCDECPAVDNGPASCLYSQYSDTSNSLVRVGCYGCNNPRRGQDEKTINKSTDNTNDNLVLRPITISANPNPFDEAIRLNIESFGQSELSINVYNTKGMLIHSSTQKIEMGEQSVQINTKDWNDGLYVIKVSSDTQNEVLKVLKQK